MSKQAWIKGFTTNPSLMKAAGVTDYVSYARELVAAAPDRHISFEVFSDDILEMIEQARLISTWGPNVYVKLPVTTTRGEPLFDAVGLSRDGIQINLTAVFISQQVASASKRSPDALPLACQSSPAISPTPALIIARLCGTQSLRRGGRPMSRLSGLDEEGLRRDRANQIKCHIIKAPAAVLKKLPFLGKVTASELSLEQLKHFARMPWPHNAAYCGSARSRMTI